jgi:hypothetical protein
MKGRGRGKILGCSVIAVSEFPHTVRAAISTKRRLAQLAPRCNGRFGSEWLPDPLRSLALRRGMRRPRAVDGSTPDGVIQTHFTIRRVLVSANNRTVD